MVSFMQYPDGGLPNGLFSRLIKGMKPHDIRLQNLQLIINTRFGGKAGRLADALGKKRPQIYRLFSDAQNRRDIGEELARDIEIKLNLPRGWLDEDQSSNELNLTPNDANFIHQVEQEIVKYEVPEHIRQTILTLVISSPPKTNK